MIFIFVTLLYFEFIIKRWKIQHARNYIISRICSLFYYRRMADITTDRELWCWFLYQNTGLDTAHTWHCRYYGVSSDFKIGVIMYIHIEFCEKWNYHPDFDRVSKLIKKIAPDAKIEGNAHPPRSGAFEVSIDNKLVYSKFKTGGFPQEPDIKSWF